MSLLKAQELIKRFGKKIAVNGVSLSVQANEIVGLLGRNGAGKTTTFKLILGLLKPNNGRVFLDGYEITKMQICKRALMGIGYLAQEPSIFINMTVRDNILAILEFTEKDKATRFKILEKIIEEYHLQKIAHQKAYTLSGGERRRVEIARVMCRSPKFILLDEPFSSVDPITIEELKSIVLGLKEKGVGVLLTDHNVRDTLSITDRAFIIDEGRIIAEGIPQEICQNPVVIEKYLGTKFKL